MLSFDVGYVMFSILVLHTLIQKKKIFSSELSPVNCVIALRPAVSGLVI